MKTILQNILSVTIGLLIGGMLNLAIVTIGPRIIPPPAGVNMSDPQSLSTSVHLLAPKHLIFPFLAHAAGTFGGAFVAYLVAASHRTGFSFVLGCLFLAGGITAATMIPAPAWFLTLDLVVAYLPMAWLAALVGRRLRPGPRPALV